MEYLKELFKAYVYEDTELKEYFNLNFFTEIYQIYIIIIHYTIIIRYIVHYKQGCRKDSRHSKFLRHETDLEFFFSDAGIF